jgi:hypothetical protein
VTSVVANDTDLLRAVLPFPTAQEGWPIIIEGLKEALAWNANLPVSSYGYEDVLEESWGPPNVTVTIGGSEWRLMCFGPTSFLQEGGTYSFSSLAAAVADMLLDHVGAEYLKLSAEHTERWDAMRAARRERMLHWDRLSEAEKTEAMDALPSAEATAAQEILEAECLQRCGRSFTALMEAAQPYEGEA